MPGSRGGAYPEPHSTGRWAHEEEEEQQLPLNLRSRIGREGEKVEEQAGSDL